MTPVADSSVPLESHESGVEIHQTLESTNTLAKERLLQGAKDGHIIIADSQTMGRGRKGRTWHSPGGKNIYLSMLVNIKSPASGLVTLMGAVAVMKSIRQLCPNPEMVQIKWPNDVLIGEKKIAGVLGEYLTERPGWCVLGIGVNVNARKQDLPKSPRWPASSLSIHLGKQVDRNGFLATLLSNLRMMRSVLESNGDKIIEQVRQNSATIGRTVLVSSDGMPPTKCKAVGIDNNGFLLVNGPKGTLTVITGDVDMTQDNEYRGQQLFHPYGE